jgi:hypothetical protein
MYSITTIKNDISIPNTYFCHEKKSDHLSLILPGLNYTCDMPLLYYTTQVMLATGADVVQVKYDYTRTQARQASSLTERFSQMKVDVIQMAQLALQQREYKHLILIGKSLGTLAIPYLLKENLPVPPQTCIFLTPILHELMPALELIQQCSHTFYVIGTRDHYYDPDLITHFRTENTDNFMTIDGANHSLEIPGEIMQSLSQLEIIIKRIQLFCKEAHP